MITLTNLDAFGSTNRFAPGTHHNVHVFPIITGTSSKMLKNEVTGFSSTSIYLAPFTLNQSINLVSIRTGISKSTLKQPRFLRLIMSLGGIPRFVDYLCQFLSLLVKPLDSILQI